jgi:hypothetical protein
MKKLNGVLGRGWGGDVMHTTNLSRVCSIFDAHRYSMSSSSWPPASIYIVPVCRDPEILDGGLMQGQAGRQASKRPSDQATSHDNICRGAIWCLAHT